MTVPKRSAQLVALVIAGTFALATGNALQVVTAAQCLYCPPDCPMHAKKPRCHGGDGQRAGAGQVRCHGPRSSGPGLRATACKGRPDGVLPADQPCVLPALPPTALWTAALFGPVLELGVPRDGVTPPPDHPPRQQSVYA